MVIPKKMLCRLSRMACSYFARRFNGDDVGDLVLQRHVRRWRRGQWPAGRGSRSPEARDAMKAFAPVVVFGHAEARDRGGVVSIWLIFSSRVIAWTRASTPLVEGLGGVEPDLAFVVRRPIARVRG